MTRTILLAVVLCALPMSASAFFRAIPDPHSDDPEHYQVDMSHPTQAELEDCFVFEIQAWNTRISDIRRRILWACNYISNRHAANLTLSERDRAIEATLLVYEDIVRKRMMDLHLMMLEGRKAPSSGSLAIVTGWYNHRNWQDRTFEELHMDIIFEE